MRKGPFCSRDIAFHGILVCTVFIKAWPEVIRSFMLNSAKHEIFPAKNVKMPTIVGILTFITVRAGNICEQVK